MMDGDADSAEEVFRAVLDEAPGTEAAVRLLYSLLHLQGRDDEKAQVLNAGLAVNDSSETLLWIKAGALEQQGDIDGAIAIYEALYTADSSNVIVANNLASLLAWISPRSKTPMAGSCTAAAITWKRWNTCAQPRPASRAIRWCITTLA